MAPLCQYSTILLLVVSFLAVEYCKSEEREITVQIVYMAKSKDSAASHIQTLASVLGSETAAKEAIIYEYTRTVNGFAALLTEDQINALLKQPAVVSILPGGFENIAAHVSSTP